MNKKLTKHISTNEMSKNLFMIETFISMSNLHGTGGKKMKERKEIKKWLIVSTVLLILTVTRVFGASVVSEFQITTDTNNQRNPSIFGNIVVWMDQRNGNPDIYGVDLSTEIMFPICTDANDQRTPAIYGSTVVWRDDRNGNPDIYGYNLSTETEFQITTNTSVQLNPALHKDIVVWRDERNESMDIYGYSISTETEFPITTAARNQQAPAVFCNIVVWRDRRNRNDDIYGAVLDTNFCRVPTYTPRSQDTTKPVMFLASFRISQARTMLEEVQKTCDVLKSMNDPLHSTCCVDGLDRIAELIEKAEQFYASGNYIAANNYALEALALLEEIQECLEQ